MHDHNHNSGPTERVEIRHVAVKLFGHVQGVGLREAIMHKAHDLHVMGFVKNEDAKNEVYFEAQGRKEYLEELVNWVRASPAWSSVDKFEVSEKPIEELPIFFVQV